MAAEPENPESKYDLREVIGRGAFGEVNLVVEKQTKQKYVLKRIKMARQSEWQRRATRQEIEIVSRLRHPFIMPYKEHWIHHGHTINVVYGYCEKGDLTSAITKQRGKLFPEEMLRLWLAELLLAVDYMHHQNVLHRDIKTQNILLTGDGDVQIGDFGLSTVRVPSSDPAQHQAGGGDDASSYGRMDSLPSILFDTADAAALGAGEATGGAGVGGQVHSSPAAHIQHNGRNPGMDAYVNGLVHAVHANGHHAAHPPTPGPEGKEKEKDHAHTPVHDPKAGTRNDYALVGTPHFMSPELLSSQKYSYETDIWSLGVVMYELTTLKPPFNAFNLAGLVAKIKRAALPPIPSNYSADWTSILKSMLRKDPGRRAAPMDLLALPSMRTALQQAVQRALAIAPDFPIPNIPLPPIAENSSGTTGFCFDVTAGAVDNNKCTPSAAGINVTPVLLNPTGMGAAGATVDDDLCGASLLDTESSPLSKFPDLAATSSPLPSVPSFVSSNDTRASAPNLAAAAAADPRRSKTPAVTRRVVTTAPGTSTTAATTGAKCAASPQRTRAVTTAATAAGAGRSKTPGRPLFGAAKAEESATAPSSRLVRRPAVPSRTGNPAGVAASPREAPMGGGLAAESSQGRVPPPSPGRKGGAVSGPTPRVPTLGSLRSASSSRRGGGLLDTAPAITVITPRDDDSEVTTPDAKQSSSARPDSTPSTGGGQKSSPLMPAPVSRTSSRAVKSASVNTARTTRAALAAAAAAASTSPNTAAAKRAEAATRRVTNGATATADASAPGTRRIVAAVASSAADGTAPVKPRATASPMRPTSAAGVAPNATAAAAARVRRSQAGAPGAAAVGVSKEAPEPATGTSGSRPRVRRLSYMSYGTKPAAPEPQPTSARRAAGAGAGIASGPATAVAVVSATTAAAAAGPGRGLRMGSREDDGALSSQPVSASDAAADSCFGGSASGSSPEMLSSAAAPGLMLGAGADGKVPASLPDHDGRTSCGHIVGEAASGAVSPVVASRRTSAAAVVGAVVVTPNGAPEPWRLASMATEDSELSLPDGSRYTASEMSNGGLAGDDSGLGTASASPSPLGTTGLAGGAQPQWNSNQLYSGSYNSLTGTLSDTSAAAVATVPAVPGVQSSGPSVTELAADLPRRVSISAFAPHLLYPGSAAAAAVTGEGEAVAGSECSTATSSPAVPAAKQDSGIAKVVPLTDRLVVLHDGRVSADVGASGSMLSPGGFNLASVSPSRENSAASTPISSTAPSPRPSPAKGPTSPGTTASARRQPGSDSPTRQYRRPGTAGATTSTTAAASTAAAQQQRRIITRTGSGRSATASSDPAPLTSSAAVAAGKRTTTTATRGAQPAGASAAATASAAGTIARNAPAAAAPAAQAMALEVGAPLRTVAEESGEEKDSPDANVKQPQPGALSTGAASSLLDQLRDSCKDLQAASAAGGSGLSDGERQQLALLQRVVSLASSLWEAGRDEELGMVLSSTLSRPLARRATRENPGGPAAIEGSDAGEASVTAAAAVVQHVAKPEVPVLAEAEAGQAETGDAVRITAGPLRGSEAVVRYRGPCHWGAGIVLGLELPVATSSAVSAADAEEPGTRDGVTYFRCQVPGSRAVFVLPDQVVRLALA